MIVPSKVVLLVTLNVLLLGKSLGVASEGREFPSYLPLEEKGPEYQILQYTPNYSFNEDYSECAKNPMIPILGKGLNILLLKLGAVGLVKAVMALMFLGMLLKLPLVLLKMAFMKSFFLPLLMAPLLLNLFSNQLGLSSDDSESDKPTDNNGGMNGMNGMNGNGMNGNGMNGNGMNGNGMNGNGMNGNGMNGNGMNGNGMNGNGMNGINGINGNGMNGMHGNKMNGMNGMSPGMHGMMGGMQGMMGGMQGMMGGTHGMMGGTHGMMGGTHGMMGGTNEMAEEKPEEEGRKRVPHMKDMSRSMTDVIMAMGRQMNDNLTTVAWESLKMFAESDQCAEKISCMIGASTKDSSIENIFTRILKYLQYTSPPFLQKRVTRIREAFRKGSRNSTCLQEDYECHSPELLLQYGIKKVKIL